MKTHPSAIDLEAYAVGDEAQSVAAHLETCADCRAFVDKLRAFVAERSTRTTPRAAIVQKAHVAKRRATVLRLATTAVLPLAAAAALFLYLRQPRGSEATTHAAAGDLTAPTDPSVGATDPETTFKGAVQLAVIRERDGQQERFTGVVRVRPGDRIRLEVALDREQAILGAVLGDDGSYVELMPAGVRGAGTHFSERAAKVDSSPMNGTLVVGNVTAIGRARAAGRATNVPALRVEWEEAP